MGGHRALCVRMASVLLGPTMVPGPRVQGPPVNTIALAPLPATQDSSRPMAAPTAAPVALEGLSSGPRGTSSACETLTRAKTVCAEMFLVYQSCQDRAAGGSWHGRSTLITKLDSILVVLFSAFCLCSVLRVRDGKWKRRKVEAMAVGGLVVW